jgi:hypothetical protein
MEAAPRVLLDSTRMWLPTLIACRVLSDIFRIRLLRPHALPAHRLHPLPVISPPSLQSASAYQVTLEILIRAALASQELTKPLLGLPTVLSARSRSTQMCKLVILNPCARGAKIPLHGVPAAATPPKIAYATLDIFVQSVLFFAELVRRENTDHKLDITRRA